MSRRHLATADAAFGSHHSGVKQVDGNEGFRCLYIQQKGRKCIDDQDFKLIETTKEQLIASREKLKRYLEVPTIRKNK